MLNIVNIVKKLRRQGVDFYCCFYFTYYSMININIKIFTLQIKGMLSKWSWIIFNFVVCTSTTIDSTQTKAFLQLIELDYEDICYSIADAQWSFIVSPSNETLLIWVDIKIKFI